MYIRHTTKTVRGKVYTNHLLVESVATPKGPRQRTICSLGDLSPRPASEWLKLAYRIESALAGQGDLLESPDGAPAPDAEVQDIVAKVRQRRARQEPQNLPARRRSVEDWVAVHTDQVTTEQAREAGPVHVGWQFCQRLGVEQILAEAGLNAKARRLSVAMILNRLIAPASEHAMPDWMRRAALTDILGFDVTALGDPALYRNLDKLHPNRARIESALVARQRDLFGLDTTVYLYDLTSTYFEGQAALNAKAQRGYSRDSRPDAKQVVVGLVINRDGFPLAHEIFAGNTQDHTTLGAMLDALARRVELQPGQTVVLDRGMAHDQDLAAIAARGMRYVVAARQSERDRVLADLSDGRRNLAHRHPADAGGKRLALHEKPAGRTAHLPSPRASRRDPHLPVRVGLPSPRSHRKNPAGSRRPHLMGHRARDPEDPPDHHHRPAYRPGHDPQDSPLRQARTPARRTLPAARRAVSNHPAPKDLGGPRSRR